MLLRIAKITAGFPVSAQMMALQQLRAFTQQDASAPAQVLAAMALGAMNVPAAREALRELLYRSTAPDQGRRSAARGLTQAGEGGCRILDEDLQGNDVKLQRIIRRRRWRTLYTAGGTLCAALRLARGIPGVGDAA